MQRNEVIDLHKVMGKKKKKKQLCGKDSAQSPFSRTWPAARTEQAIHT